MNRLPNNTTEESRLRARASLMNAQTRAFITILHVFPGISERGAVAIASEIFGYKSLENAVDTDAFGDQPVYLDIPDRERYPQ